ncbi:hypothetical protein SD70_07970 [Gordoniibacillus kamchatkensis]|uniref:Transcriptional regulator LacI/GalR-like sensor domain-containing protein n=1 Tax=Gordoniibacillus kamchatkensis TaxID=1590651 RepID=A0ABR5AK00_9BACL|nr:substrate-binding domain-containing protein [Paenibacillus sp. VKM B-2647]KIL41366.1 hypothetical protein SD70_07970 [Paenibacillus sp. VKM B-2647]
MICFDDVIAIGLIKSFTAAGLQVPEHLSVVGFDDIELTTFPLSSVSIPTYDGGKALARKLFDRIFGKEAGSYEHMTLQEKLIVRSSVKPIYPQ